MNIINRIFGPPRRRMPPPPPPPLTAHEQEMAEESQRQDEMRQRETAARVSSGTAESVSAGLEEFLQRSQDNLEARLMAVTKRRTAELEAKAIKAEHELERKTRVAESEQKKAEMETAQLRYYSAAENYEIGCIIFEAFFESGRLTDAQIEATISSPQAKKELEEAKLLSDPRLIKAVLKRFRGYTTNQPLFSKVLPDANLQEYFRQMVVTPSAIPFWNF